jgi:hypothetical protein
VERHIQSVLELEELDLQMVQPLVQMALVVILEVLLLLEVDMVVPLPMVMEMRAEAVVVEDVMAEERVEQEIRHLQVQAKEIMVEQVLEVLSGVQLVVVVLELQEVVEEEVRHQELLKLVDLEEMD